MISSGGRDSEWRSHAVAEKAELAILEHRIDDAGALDLLAVIPDQADVSFRFRGPSDLVGPARVLRFKRIRQEDVNQWAIEGADCRWSLGSMDCGARLGADISPNWSLENERTYFIRTERRLEDPTATVQVRLCDPLTGGSTAVQPGVRYEASILAAIHRCAASVVLEIVDAAGQVILSEQRAIDPAFKGGREAKRFQRIRFEVEAPKDAAFMELRVDKSASDQGDDSYAFLARPSLAEVRDGRSAPSLTTSAAGLALIRQNPQTPLFELRLEPPAALIDQDGVELELVIEAKGQRRVLGALSFERHAKSPFDRLDVEGDLIQFAGECHSDYESARIQVLIDGQLDSEVDAPAKDGRFSGKAAISAAWLDGQVHLVELRLAPWPDAIGRQWALLADSLTPWPTIQARANGSVRYDRSPAAGHDLRAFRVWAARSDAGKPPILSLHDELLRGRTERQHRTPLTFPPAAEPAVTVVVSTGEHFEAAYQCLCSLLFAPNRSTFEVIVADSGSGEASSKLKPLVEGVRFVHQAGGAERARRAASQIARGPKIAWISDSVEATAGWLDEMIGVFDDFDDVGLVGARVIGPDGRVEHASGGFDDCGRPASLGRNANPEDPRFNRLREAEWVSGDALLGRGDILLAASATGFGGGSDQAVSANAKAQGSRVVYAPAATLYRHPPPNELADGAINVAESVSAPDLAPPSIKDELAPTGPRVLFVDRRCPRVDSDAGSYAAFQEIRLLQRLGARVAFLPRDLAWLDRHTEALQRIGVECLHAPFVTSFNAFLRDHAGDFDLVYVNRYKIAGAILPVIRKSAPDVKVVLNLADLHFLREMREADAGSPGYSHERALETRAAELEAIEGCDLALSYSEVELALLRQHLGQDAKIAKLPWVAEAKDSGPRDFDRTQGLLFLGGFGHPPNVEAVKRFVRQVMPLVAERLPDAVLNVVGSSAPPEIAALESASVRISGFVPELDEVFQAARVFVAPLQAGAGIKGKVIEAMARGATIVLSPVAAEATGLQDEVNCLIAETPQDWAEAIFRAYTDQDLWRRLGSAALDHSRKHFTFEAGVEVMRGLLERLGAPVGDGMVYRGVRPRRSDV